MADNLKGDLLNGAYSELRISGITVEPTPSDLELGLMKLEDMAEEWYGTNICTGYQLEDEPDPNTPHNVPRKYWRAFKANLAVILMPDFGKGMAPDPMLIKNAGASMSALIAMTAPRRETQYPTRMARGSGNTRFSNRWSRFYKEVAEVPLECDSKTMYIDDINDFVEGFDAYLNASEDISSFTIEADTGLTVTTSANATPNITYTIRADGGGSGSSEGLLQVKIVATTTDSRIETRIINFQLIKSDVID